MNEKKLNSFLKKQTDLLLAYQFGSSLSGDLHEESDIDFAILFDKKPSYQRVLELTEKLTDILNKEVDLSILNEASPIFCMQVISKGINIYCRDTKARSYFVIRTVNEYDDLSYFRRFQQKNILKGRIFA